MGNQSDRACFFVDSQRDVSCQVFEIARRNVFGREREGISDWTSGTRGTLFIYPQPRAGHTTARDVLLTQTSATMSAMTTQAHAARLAANASRVTVRPRARPRARARDLPERRSTTPGFANRQTNV